MRPIDIIVPIYRNAGLVKACVDSLLAHCEEIEMHRPRLILIDDSPADTEVACLLDGYESSPVPVRVLRNEANLGFVRSVNRGLQIARELGHDALLVNSDTVTFAGTLSQLLRAANADPQIGFASPRSNNASICSLPHQQGVGPARPDEAHRRWATLSHSLPAFHFVPTAVGFYMFVAHAVIANVGLLREDFGLGYEEENDLVMRAGKIGYRAVMANHAFVFHAGAASFDLTGLDLAEHRHGNLLKLVGMHPEFLPLVARYERSPHFRAERLMSGLLPDVDGRMKVVFDLSEFGPQRDDGGEQVTALIEALARGHGHRLQVSAVCTARCFEALGLAALPGVLREEPGASGLHGIAVHIRHSLGSEALARLDGLAPINLFALRDTCAEDCGPLALASAESTLWNHVAEHAHGLVFFSQMAKQTFCARHPAALALPHFTRLHPTRREAGGMASQLGASPGQVFVWGSGLAHEGVEAAAVALAAAFPELRTLAPGTDMPAQDNADRTAASRRQAALMGQHLAQALVVVLPAYIGGFPEGLLQALGAARPVVARRLPATEEVLATLDQVHGVYLFDTDADLVSAVAEALKVKTSSADDSRAISWDDWAEGFAEFCLAQPVQPRAFGRLAGRLAAAGRPGNADRSQDPETPGAPAGEQVAAAGAVKATDLNTLLSMEGREFVSHAYATLLRRVADNAGLEFYLGQLRDGVSKLDILRALAISPEGRTRDVKLQGLEERLSAQNRHVAQLFKRLFRR